MRIFPLVSVEEDVFFQIFWDLEGIRPSSLFERKDLVISRLLGYKKLIGSLSKDHKIDTTSFKIFFSNLDNFFNTDSFFLVFS